jgi:hypothetical protein
LFASREAFFVRTRSAEDAYVSTRAKRDEELAEKDRARRRKSRRSMK